MSIYLQAAELIASGIETHACVAISATDNYDVKSERARGKFTDTFCPKNIKYGEWFGPPIEENQLARSLALLFMHEIEQDEK